MAHVSEHYKEAEFHALPTESADGSKAIQRCLLAKASLGLGFVALVAIFAVSRQANASNARNSLERQSFLRAVPERAESTALMLANSATDSFDAVNVVQPLIVIGWPTSGYHNVTIWVYIKALQQLNYNNIKTITYPHPQLYPMFTGGEPLKNENGVPVCKEKGCAELCRAHGFSASPCIDMVGDSNIPVNHATWLVDFQDQYDVVGTAFETQYIALFAPDYAPFKSLSAAASNSATNKSIVGMLSGPGDNCDAGFCPKCSTQPFLKDETGPILKYGYTFQGYKCPDFDRLVAEKLAKRELFLVEMWIPMFWNARFPQLQPLDMEQYTQGEKPNQGKILIRKDRRYKFSSKALSVIGAIFIGTNNVQVMDSWANGIGLDEPLCNYWDYDHGCAKEAAQKWIDANRANQLWDSFFW